MYVLFWFEAKEKAIESALGWGTNIRFLKEVSKIYIKLLCGTGIQDFPNLNCWVWLVGSY